MEAADSQRRQQPVRKNSECGCHQIPRQWLGRRTLPSHHSQAFQQRRHQARSLELKTALAITIQGEDIEDLTEELPPPKLSTLLNFILLILGKLLAYFPSDLEPAAENFLPLLLAFSHCLAEDQKPVLVKQALSFLPNRLLVPTELDPLSGGTSDGDNAGVGEASIDLVTSLSDLFLAEPGYSLSCKTFGLEAVSQAISFVVGDAVVPTTYWVIPSNYRISMLFFYHLAGSEIAT